MRHSVLFRPRDTEQCALNCANCYLCSWGQSSSSRTKHSRVTCPLRGPPPSSRLSIIKRLRCSCSTVALLESSVAWQSYRMEPSGAGSELKKIHLAAPSLSLSSLFLIFPSLSPYHHHSFSLSIITPSLLIITPFLSLFINSFFLSSHVTPISSFISEFSFRLSYLSSFLSPILILVEAIKCDKALQRSIICCIFRTRSQTSKLTFSFRHSKCIWPFRLGGVGYASIMIGRRGRSRLQVWVVWAVFRSLPYLHLHLPTRYLGPISLGLAWLCPS